MTKIDGPNPMAYGLNGAKPGDKTLPAPEPEIGGATRDGIPTGDGDPIDPVQITLSPEAQDFLNSGGEPAGPGKSHLSMAHQARAALELEQFASLPDMPFGKLVSTLARGGNIESLLPPIPETEALIEPESDEPVPADEPAPEELPPVAGDIEPKIISEAELALALLQSTDEEAGNGADSEDQTGLI